MNKLSNVTHQELDQLRLELWKLARYGNTLGGIPTTVDQAIALKLQLMSLNELSSTDREYLNLDRDTRALISLLIQFCYQQSSVIRNPEATIPNYAIEAYKELRDKYIKSQTLHDSF